MLMYFLFFIYIADADGDNQKTDSENVIAADMLFVKSIGNNFRWKTLFKPIEIKTTEAVRWISESERNRKKRMLRRALTFKPHEFLREVLIVFCVVLALNSFVLASFVVPTGSMENTVKPGDFLFVNKFIYGRNHSLYHSAGLPSGSPICECRVFAALSAATSLFSTGPGSRDQVGKTETGFLPKTLYWAARR